MAQVGISNEQWSAFRGGSVSPVLAVFAEHHEPALNFAYRMIGDPDRAETVTQKSLLGLVRERRRSTSKTALARGLYREIMRQCLEEKRRAEPADGRGEDPAGRVETALRRLPCEARGALLLSRIEGFDAEDVAECIGTSVDGARDLLKSAGRRLAAELGDLLE